MEQGYLGWKKAFTSLPVMQVSSKRNEEILVRAERFTSSFACFLSFVGGLLSTGVPNMRLTDFFRYSSLKALVISAVLLADILTDFLSEML